MPSKHPVLLCVLIETSADRWYTAGVSLQGEPTPLVCSHPGDLAAYHGAAFDDQVTFLRHRFSGVLQRGCDRLWGRGEKPCQIVFVADAPFDDSMPLTRGVADHFAEWMVYPVSAFFLAEEGFSAGRPHLERIGGTIEAGYQEALEEALPRLTDLLGQDEKWETAPLKRA